MHWKVKGATEVRIGELAAISETTTKTLRFYEASGLLHASRRPNGYREYTEDALARLDFIRRGRAAGLTLAQIRDVLAVRDRGHAPCHHVAELLATRLRELDGQIGEMQAMRAAVADLHDAASPPDPANCRPEQVCRYL